MKMSRWILRAAVLLAIPVGTTNLLAQATTSAISARVTDANGVPKSDARVVAVHLPSGTLYQGRTRDDGRVTIPGMRVGGPYRITATLLGNQPDVENNVFLQLGVTTELRFTLSTVPLQLSAVTVTGESETVFSSERTGAATSVPREAVQALPTISARIEDLVRLTPQYSGAGFGFSFAGQDNRLNNVQIDGAAFNNSFGLAGQPGDRTGVAPISMDAIEQVQVNVAPMDVRYGNFIGAGVNTVTRSGTNEFRGSLQYAFRDNQRALHGTQAGPQKVDPGKFEFSRLGASLGGPIIKNKLFFFANYESDENTSPATTYIACTDQALAAGTCNSGNTTRVLSRQLDSLSTFLQQNFGYTTGPYQGYEFKTPATRYLAKLDYNLNAANKVSVRYSQLDSYTDQLVSNSSSLGFGSRRSSLFGLNFQNSNYQILENIKSFAGEWNSIIGSRMANNLILTRSFHDESRKYVGQFFPMVDILSGSSVYTTFGFEPFTPNNELRYGNWQLVNNFSIYGRKHDIVFGASSEWYHSENVFFPGSQSAYVYNSLTDFYTDANNFLTKCGTNSATWSTCNPTAAAPAITQRRFQVRWSNIPGQVKPIQPLDVLSLSAYAQDQWRVTDQLRLTFGVRVDRPSFDETGFANAEVDTMQFRDRNYQVARYSTKKLPDPKLMFSPRFGFNWDVTGDRVTQVRGGTGIFTGRPAYVWISNQIGNNGVMTGFERLDNTTARPFHADPDHYKPAAASITGAPASSYELALTDPDFKFLQLWRSNVAVDRKLPWGLVGTGEFLYSKDVNGVYYINANLSKADSTFTGADKRARWTTDDCPTISGVQQRLQCKIDNAVVLQNENSGFAWNMSASLEKPFGQGTFVKAAYSYGVAKNTVDPGSIAFGSWNGNPTPSDPNNPGVGFAQTSPGHRLFIAGSMRRNYFRFGATTTSLYWEMRNNGSSSYVFSGDMNGDGGTGNDLIYVAKDTSEMNFVPFTASGVTWTRQQQQQAWEAFIQQDDYLKGRRGEYAERNAVFVPFVKRADLSVAQEVSSNFLGHRNAMEVRLDFVNIGNLLNHNWGIGKRFITTSPLIPTNAAGTCSAACADANGAATYRLRNIGSQLINETFQQSAGLIDVYKIQLMVRYTFN